MEAMVCCTCVQDAASPRMTQGEQGYFLSHLVFRFRHCKQLRFLTLLLPGKLVLAAMDAPLDGPAAAPLFVVVVAEGSTAAMTRTMLVGKTMFRVGSLGFDETALEYAELRKGCRMRLAAAENAG